MDTLSRLWYPTIWSLFPLVPGIGFTDGAMTGNIYGYTPAYNRYEVMAEARQETSIPSPALREICLSSEVSLPW